jgi:predicted component of type VI protein secretion system
MNALFEIFVVSVVLAALGFHYKKLLDMSNMLSAMQARMDGIQSFADTLMDIMTRLHLMERRLNDEPVTHERRKDRKAQA